MIVLGWPKSSFEFFCNILRNIFLANPILFEEYLRLNGY